MNDTINIYNSEVYFPGGESAQSAVNVIGTFRAVNKMPVHLSASSDKSSTSVHFLMVPLVWEPDDEGQIPDDLGSDAVLMIQRVHCNRASISISAFSVNSSDGVASVTLGNPTDKELNIGAGEICIDVLAIKTGDAWRAPAPIAPAPWQEAEEV